MRYLPSLHDAALFLAQIGGGCDRIRTIPTSHCRRWPARTGGDPRRRHAVPIQHQRQAHGSIGLVCPARRWRRSGGRFWLLAQRSISDLVQQGHPGNDQPSAAPTSSACRPLPSNAKPTRPSASTMQRRRRRSAGSCATGPGGSSLPGAQGIQPHGIKAEGEALLIPLRDAVNHFAQPAKPSAPEGIKRFQPGGRITRAATLASAKPKGVLIVCEGFATGASIHEATGHAVAVRNERGQCWKWPRHCTAIPSCA